MTNETPDVGKLLKEAFKAVQEAGIPPELQAAALEKAVDLLAGVPADRALPAAPRTPGAAGEDTLDAIADGLGLKREVVEEVYYQDDEGLKIVIGTAKLEPAKTAGAKQLALLVVAGRQASGLEEWTAMKEVRDVAKEFNRFDSANFSTTVKEMDDVFRFTGSSPSERKVKLNRKGKEDAAALITQLTGGERS